jgi:hypothetical protein
MHTRFSQVNAAVLVDCVIAHAQALPGSTDLSKADLLDNLGDAVQFSSPENSATVCLKVSAVQRPAPSQLTPGVTGTTDHSGIQHLHLPMPQPLVQPMQPMPPQQQQQQQQQQQLGTADKKRRKRATKEEQPWGNYTLQLTDKYAPRVGKGNLRDFARQLKGQPCGDDPVQKGLHEEVMQVLARAVGAKHPDANTSSIISKSKAHQTAVNGRLSLRRRAEYHKSRMAHNAWVEQQQQQGVLGAEQLCIVRDGEDVPAWAGHAAVLHEPQRAGAGGGRPVALDEGRGAERGSTATGAWDLQSEQAWDQGQLPPGLLAELQANLAQQLPQQGKQQIKPPATSKPAVVHGLMGLMDEALQR